MKRIYISLILAFSCAFAMASPNIFAPELVSPANNAAAQTPDVVLDWTTVVGQTGMQYVLHLSTDAAFTNPVEFITELSRYKMKDLMFAGQYFWKVKAVDASGSSDWTEVRSFSVVARPVLRRPNNNSVVDINVDLQWDPMTGVASFQYQFDLVNTFDSPELRDYLVVGAAVSGTPTSKAPAARLLFGETYFLRIRAIHNADTSDWSEERFVKTLDVFQLKKPANAATGVDIMAEVQWTEIKGIDKYSIFISTDPGFQHFETYTAGKALKKMKPDTLNFDTKYFWRMAAIHSKDTLLSDTLSFTTLKTVSLSSPANNATNIVMRPDLGWTKMAGILSYDLELDSHSDFSNARSYNIPATTGSGLERFNVPLHVLDSASVYYWRVKANSSRDTSVFSPTWNFRTAALGINDPGAISNGLKIYPSPAVNTINIKMSSNLNGVAEVTLFDLLGKMRVVKKSTVVAGLIKDFDLGALPDGIYILQLNVNGFKTMSKVVVKK